MIVSPSLKFNRSIINGSENGQRICALDRVQSLVFLAPSKFDILAGGGGGGGECNARKLIYSLRMPGPISHPACLNFTKFIGKLKVSEGGDDG